MGLKEILNKGLKKITDKGSFFENDLLLDSFEFLTDPTKEEYLKKLKKRELLQSNLKEKLIDGIEPIKKVQVVLKKNPLKNLEADL
jgi:hypothetical protein